MFNYWKLKLAILLFIITAVYFFNDGKSGDEKSALLLTSYCNSSQENKKQCWEKQLIDILDQKNLNIAFDFISELYASESEFSKDCHPYMHIVGQYAYKKYYNDGKIDIGPKTIYCGYGFYHGFMEALILDGHNPKEAKDFCMNADKELSRFTNKTIVSCFHGIGHGTVDGSDPRAWGDSQAIIKPGLDICKAISDDDQIRFYCATGVFNSLAIALNNNSYNLKFSDNPYDSCYNLNEDYSKQACYLEMNTHVLRLADNDFSKAVKYINNIPEKKYVEPAMAQLAGAAIAYGNDTRAEYAAVCRSTVISDSCLRGLVSGILEHGEPNREYEEVISFCENSNLNKEEKINCYSDLINLSKALYPSEKFREICGAIGPEFTYLCPNS